GKGGEWRGEWERGRPGCGVFPPPNDCRKTVANTAPAGLGRETGPKPLPQLLVGPPLVVGEALTFPRLPHPRLHFAPLFLGTGRVFSGNLFKAGPVFWTQYRIVPRPRREEPPRSIDRFPAQVARLRLIVILILVAEIEFVGDKECHERLEVGSHAPPIPIP